jgi:hypothetical protein
MIRHLYALSALAVVSTALALAADYVGTSPIEQELYEEHLKAVRFEVAGKLSEHLTIQEPREAL